MSDFGLCDKWRSLHPNPDCLRSGRLFVDNTFPPNSGSLGDLPDLSTSQENDAEWLRPADILKLQKINDEPAFCIDGASRFDFGQGTVGNCWFLSAISALTFQKKLLAQVVPLDQSFKNYAGIFHFRFWRFGKWVDVIIDDYLPTINKQLLLANSKCGNEFWVPLLEKAYAKICGSYADMHWGSPSESFKDFTGGVTMTYKLREAHSAGHDAELWLTLKRAIQCKSLICSGTFPKEDALANTISHTGLVDAHIYSVTAVTEVELYSSKVRLVRLMNPWGKQEWNGKWSDKMQLEDFCYYFSHVCICCENPNFIDGDLKCQWKCMIYDGSWVAGRSAGGGVNNSTFATNPQYRIQVSVIDKEEPEDKNILLSLMQKPQQGQRRQRRFYPVGLTIYKTLQGHLGSSFFDGNNPLKTPNFYSFNSDLTELHSLEPGEYVIIPSTMKPNMTADFALTVYTKADVEISSHSGGDEEEELILPQIRDKPKEETTEKDANLISLFNLYANQNGELLAGQLQKLLNDRFPHGLNVNDRTVRLMMFRYSRFSVTTLEDFITLMLRLDKMSNIFKDKSSDGTMRLTWDEWSNISMYN
ncbi:calpain-8-like [Pelmatolapia mariae]|uniref:calpain-8-like n=1 Tax=Pelmatolapia mariae TaxID=158779 RepID=UPI002FE5C9A0